jgi:hypothetical protein
MEITVWHGDKKKFRGKLPTRTDASGSYAKWCGETYLVKNGDEIWLTGTPPKRLQVQVQGVESNCCLPSTPLPPVPEGMHIQPSPYDSFLNELASNEKLGSEDSSSRSDEVPKWDPSQESVIQASRQARMLVSAGPGTGKTAVACKRVAHLIDECECNPNKVWIISFTRTAVAEIRARIASYLTDKYQAFSIKIATLDSHAWSLNSGFDEEASLNGSFESNIDAVIDLVKKDEDALYYLKTVDHLIVDEAQDFTGNRMSLVLEIIDKLQDDAGVTVFADEAQAIYGFSARKSATEFLELNLTLPHRIRQQGTFLETHLTTIHRTSSAGLTSIFSETRNEVLKESSHALLKYHRICDEIRKKADFIGDSEFDPLRLPQENNCFALFRSKKEVLKASSTMDSKPHRIRMGNISSAIVPWVGALLSGVDEHYLRSRDVKSLWSERGIGGIAQGLDPDSAWDSLKKLGGGTRTPKVDLAKLRQNLARQNLTPDLLLPELGVKGPILGTIHAAKGREADHVYLCIPPKVIGNNTDYDEETRVMFVGATRARDYLHVYTGFQSVFGNSAGEERVWEKVRCRGRYAARVQIGCPTDIDLGCLAAQNLYESEDEVMSNQVSLRRLAEILPEAAPLNLTAKNKKGRYELLTDNGQRICMLSQKVTDSLFDIGRRLNNGNSGVYPPFEITGIKLMDLCTLVASEESSICSSLHSPWRENGIIIAPRIIGFPWVNFNG